MGSLELPPELVVQTQAGQEVLRRFVAVLRFVRRQQEVFCVGLRFPDRPF
jgi:hypothetical protein